MRAFRSCWRRCSTTTTTTTTKVVAVSSLALAATIATTTTTPRASAEEQVNKAEIFPQKTKKKKSTNKNQHAALKHGVPRSSYTTSNETFVVAFDYRTRNPRWVVELLTNESVRQKKFSREKETFHEAPLRLGSKLADFRGAPYDRGHMAPARDCAASAESLRDSFSLLNVSPQVAALNRRAWSRFEHFVRGIALQGAADEVRVVTGPLFLPRSRRADVRYPTIGDSSVHVPTHFFKVILAETSLDRRTRSSGGVYAVGCFVFPNTEVPDDAPLTDFVASLDALESAAGIEFFPSLLGDDLLRTRLREAEKKWVPSSSSVIGKKNAFLLETSDEAPRRRRRRQRGWLRAEPVDDDDDDGDDGEKTAPSPKGQPQQEVTISHLCDRHRCELVSARWIDDLQNKKKNRKAPPEDEDSDVYDSDE